MLWPLSGIFPSVAVSYGFPHRAQMTQGQSSKGPLPLQSLEPKPATLLRD